ncbi:MAG: BMC domain-containing protein [Verrucomicrobiae bacterium]|nr:BMC domain-containing protein [Verrucomicrobiae bacterium]
MKKTSIGVVELSSVAAGYAVVDAMLKAANVEPLVFRTICSGKYLAMIAGDVADVKAAVEAGAQAGQTSVIDTTVLSNLHPDIFSSVAGNQTIELKGALGVIESFSTAALVEAADTAIKAADVKIMEIRLAMALGGKAFVSLTGAVAAVEASVEAGAAVLAERGVLVNKVVIARPRPELLNEII